MRSFLTAAVIDTLEESCPRVAQALSLELTKHADFYGENDAPEMAMDILAKVLTVSPTWEHCVHSQATAWGDEPISERVRVLGDIFEDIAETHIEPVGATLNILEFRDRVHAWMKLRPAP